MPTLKRALTNLASDCKFVLLDANQPKSPLVVMQEGYAPSDPTCRMRMFYLQHDGMWIDEIARHTLPADQAFDVVFDSAADALQVFAHLFGKPIVRPLPVSDADVERYAARARGTTGEAAFRELLARYRAAKQQA